MPKFDVILKEIEIYEFPDIEAETEFDAIERAYELLYSKEKHNYHNDSDGEAEARER